MKSIIVSIGLFIAATFIVKAQDVRFGVYAAPQVSWLMPEAKNADNKGNIVKFSGGLTINKFFAENYALSTGIAIASQGGKIYYDSTSTNTLNVYDETFELKEKTVRYDLQYINIPIGLKLQSNEIGYLRFHVLLGFTNQFNIGAKATDETDEQFKDDAIKNDVNIYNLGYHFGGGIDYSLGEDTALFLSVVYENGFIDVIKSDPKIYSRVVSIRMGINF